MAKWCYFFGNKIERIEYFCFDSVLGQVPKHFEKKARENSNTTWNLSTLLFWVHNDTATFFLEKCAVDAISHSIAGKFHLSQSRFQSEKDVLYISGLYSVCAKISSSKRGFRYFSLFCCSLPSMGNHRSFRERRTRQGQGMYFSKF